MRAVLTVLAAIAALYAVAAAYIGYLAACRWAVLHAERRAMDRLVRDHTKGGAE